MWMREQGSERRAGCGPGDRAPTRPGWADSSPSPGSPCTTWVLHQGGQGPQSRALMGVPIQRENPATNQ